MGGGAQAPAAPRVKAPPIADHCTCRGETNTWAATGRSVSRTVAQAADNKGAVVGLSFRCFHIVVCSAFLALRLAFEQDPVTSFKHHKENTNSTKAAASRCCERAGYPGFRSHSDIWWHEKQCAMAATCAYNFSKIGDIGQLSAEGGDSNRLWTWLCSRRVRAELRVTNVAHAVSGCFFHRLFVLVCTDVCACRCMCLSFKLGVSSVDHGHGPCDIYLVAATGCRQAC